MAVDYSKMSDKELEERAFGGNPQVDYSKMSDAELEARAFGKSFEAPKTSALEAAGIGFQKGATLGLRPVVAGAGAGLGAFIGNLTTDLPKEGLMDKVSRSVKAIPEAYSQGRKEAVSEQLKAATDQPGASLIGEIGGGALTIPFTGVKTLSGAAKLGTAQGAANALSEAESLPEAVEKMGTGTLLGAASFGAAKAVPHVTDAIGRTAGYVGDKAKSGLVKVASALTGETEQNIRTFASRTKEVNKLISESGGDISEAADQVRQKITNDIQSFRKSMNAKIGSALDQYSPEKNIDPSGVIKGMEKVKSRINSTLDPEGVQQIDEAVGRIKALAGDTERLSLKELHDVQNFLSERAKGSYMKGGQIFVPGKDSQLAANAGAREAKSIIDVLAPEIKEANSKLFQLHRIEDNLNKNLIRPGASQGALLAAGGADNSRNKKILGTLGNLIGKDVVGQAENLSAASAFANPSLLPRDATGKSMTRLAVSTGLGMLAGGHTGIVAGALSSPMALKAAIQAGQIPRAFINAIGGSKMTTDTLFKYLNTPQGMSALNQMLQNSPASGAIARRMRDIDSRSPRQAVGE